MYAKCELEEINIAKDINKKTLQKGEGFSISQITRKLLEIP